MTSALATAAFFTLAAGTYAECQAFSRHVTHHIVGIQMTVDGTSAFVSTPCVVSGGSVAMKEPDPGEVVIFAVRSVDPNTGARSDWTGGP